jgi:hypothetical protein
MACLAYEYNGAPSSPLKPYSTTWVAHAHTVGVAHTQALRVCVRDACGFTHEWDDPRSLTPPAPVGGGGEDNDDVWFGCLGHPR